MNTIMNTRQERRFFSAYIGQEVFYNWGDGDGAEERKGTLVLVDHNDHTLSYLVHRDGGPFWVNTIRLEKFVAAQNETELIAQFHRINRPTLETEFIIEMPVMT